ncbi:MAG: aminotransferase class I/II-fold pyridoxal phosphate-dependent enzyme, partial [Lachnospiraceae bacterium]|nr:aminotransferase class I/II-fold pyridoxal phosphate-dependent enzyme [Lachnospiraceae bacterium]
MSFEDKLRKIKPYVAGEQPQQSNVIKLNTNENPYPPAPEVQERSREFVTDILKKYPDPDIHLLNAALAKYHGVDEKRVFSGVGSDDVLSVAFLSFFDSDLPILFPDITYAFYPVWATLYRIPFTEIPLDENYRIRPEDYYGDVKENGGVVIANPNAPTSIAESADFIEDIVRHNPNSVVVVDEAYVDFGAESVLKLTEKYENLLVVRTFSKSRSMAGIRI